MKIAKFILIWYCILSWSLSAQSVMNQYEAGLRLLDEGKSVEASKIFSQIITDKPYYYDAYVGRARCFAKEGKEKEALADFSKALEIKSNWYEALYYRGQMHSSAGRHRQALSDYDASLRSRQGWIPALQAKGNTLWELGRKEEALKALDEAIALAAERKVLSLYIERSRMRAGISKAQGAVDDLTIAIALPGAHDSLLLLRAELFLPLGDTLEALKDYDRYLGRNPGAKAARMRRALLNTSRGEYTLALGDLSRLIQDDKVTNDVRL
ncbi:MAG: tetratricopeptide repeat protein, partial [Bacteroidales bacterium]|nr:tetratricopeptide repeat protein [Bacteroidales bacterium]